MAKKKEKVVPIDITVLLILEIASGLNCIGVAIVLFVIGILSGAIITALTPLLPFLEVPRLPAGLPTFLSLWNCRIYSKHYLRLLLFMLIHRIHEAPTPFLRNAAIILAIIGIILGAIFPIVLSLTLVAQIVALYYLTRPLVVGYFR